MNERCEPIIDIIDGSVDPVYDKECGRGYITVVEYITVAGKEKVVRVKRCGKDPSSRVQIQMVKFTADSMQAVAKAMKMAQKRGVWKPVLVVSEDRIGFLALL